MDLPRRALFGAVGAGLLGAACSGAERAPAPPSILLVVVDTLRPDHLGLYGYGRATSPELDRRAARALVFERAQAPSSWTLPSMASLFTGQLPSRHTAGVERDAAGEIVRSEARRKAFRILPSAVETLTETLRSGGYATGAFLTNEFLGERFGFAQGFDVFEHHGEARAAEVVDAALAWLALERERPTFTFVHLFDPHLPYHAGAPFAGRFTAGLPSGLELPVEGLGKLRRRVAALSADDRDFLIAAYDEELAYVDHHLARLFDALDERGDFDTSLVVLTSDHGEELFDHDGFEHGHTMYQELLHVPLIVWSPGIEPRRVAEPVSLLDVTATLLDVAGARPPAPLQGSSLLDFAVPPAIVSEGNLYDAEQRALLRWPHKLIADGSRRVFDLDADPGELFPLADDALLERLERDLDARLEAAAALAPGATPAELDEETLERLRDLGYVDH